MDKDTYEKLCEKHGKVHVYEIDDGTCVAITSPNRQQYRKFKDDVLNEKKTASCLENLLREVLVYPSHGELDTMLQKRPGLAEVFGKKATEVAGADAEAVEKKFLASVARHEKTNGLLPSASWPFSGASIPTKPW